MKPWTDEDVAELRRLRARGESFGVIAKRLRRSRNAVLGKADRLGIRPQSAGGSVRAVPAAPVFGGRRPLRDYQSCWRDHHADARDLDVLAHLAAGATPESILAACPKLRQAHLAALVRELETVDV